MAAISATAMKTRDIVKAIMTQPKVMVENLKTTSWGSINKAERVPGIFFWHPLLLKAWLLASTPECGSSRFPEAFLS